MSVRIDRWAMIHAGGPYDAPETAGYFLRGVIHGHDEHADGTPVETSPIVAVVDGKIRTRSGTLYELGEPEPEYEAAYPGARERLLTTVAVRS